MAENAKDADERDLRGGRGCAPVRLVDQERRAELDRKGHGRSFTGVQFLGILGYAIGVQGSPNLEERQRETTYNRCFRMACAARPTRAPGLGELFLSIARARATLGSFHHRWLHLSK